MRFAVRIQTVSEDGRQTTERTADSIVEALALSLRNHSDEIPFGLERTIAWLASSHWLEEVSLDGTELDRWANFREVAKNVFGNEPTKGVTK